MSQELENLKRNVETLRHLIENYCECGLKLKEYFEMHVLPRESLADDTQPSFNFEDGPQDP